MAWQVAQRLAPQVSRLSINANRHLDIYARWPWLVCPDDIDLPLESGPLIGILTGLRHATASWLQVQPCDSPSLPIDLVTQLLQAAEQAQADIAVPVTPAHLNETERTHWTCALIRTSTRDSLEAAVQQGERRVRQWITQGRWIGVSFDRADAFININAPETLHAQR